MNILETERLLLRPWKASDLKPFSRMNSNPKVMEYFPKTLSEEESTRFAEKIAKGISNNGWGLWAAERKADGKFIGYVGLNRPDAELPFYPRVEVGWRLSEEYWGMGYATEAGLKALDFANSSPDITEVVSFTAAINKRSEAVMKRLGMIKVQERFFHPNIPKNDRLCEHILYKISVNR
ncbi:GNAT family N-acetyltransferase [Aurantivibrio plasticivorans]